MKKKIEKFSDLDQGSFGFGFICGMAFFSILLMINYLFEGVK